jgi:hypothetical protein
MQVTATIKATLQEVADLARLVDDRKKFLAEVIAENPSAYTPRERQEFRAELARLEQLRRGM